MLSCLPALVEFCSKRLNQREKEGDIWSAGAKKNGGGKGGQYLEKENILEGKKLFFGEGKYF